jgi:hypothetical protein
MFRIAVLAGLAVALLSAPDGQAADPRADYSELSKLIQEVVAAKLPRQWEDRSGWGQTVPYEPGLPLPRLRRMVQVGKNYELPHGTWKRTRVWLDEPARDVLIEVKDLRKEEGKPYRLKLTATIAGHGEKELKQWQKGLQLLGVTAQADAVVVVRLDCDVTASVNVLKLPPEVRIEPKVADVQLELREFRLHRVGPLLAGPQAQQLGDELKGTLEALLKSYEPQVKDFANESLARSLQESRGKISVTRLLKAITPAMPPTAPSGQ